MSQDSFLEGLLNQERTIRAKVQTEVRAYQSLLLELAIRFNTYQLDEGKKQNPEALQGWTSSEWQTFWHSFHPNFSWRDSDCEEQQKEVLQLKQFIQDAQAELSTLIQNNHSLNNELSVIKRKLSQVEAFSKFQKKPLEHKKIVPDLKNVPTAYHEAVTSLRSLPDVAPPLAFLHKFKKNVQRWPRKHRVLFLMAHYGWSSRKELQNVVALAEGLKPKNGSLRRAMVDLEQSGLITREKMEVDFKKEEQTVVILLKLNPDGRRCCRLLGWEPVMPEELSIQQMKDAGRFIPFTQHN